MTDVPADPVEVADPVDAIDPVATADAEDGTDQQDATGGESPDGESPDAGVGFDPPEAADDAGATLDEPVVPPESWCIVAVAEVSLDLPDAYPAVVLHEAQHPWRELRIPVGLPDGTAIAYALRGIETPRPLTHTLVAEIFERHGVSVEAVRITVRRGQSFFAEIDTTGPNGRHVIPCRPSDAIALALRRRLPTPILVAEWVFDDEG
jgi:uncharacterized protein